MSRRAVVYLRISQDREGAGLGVERQREDCAALARKLGWEVVAVHADNDMSASNGKPRPGYRALLADLGAGRATAVLAWHTDRLHRSPRELETYVDLCERQGVVTHTVKAGEIDLAHPAGRAVARTLGAWARYEIEHKAERTRRAQLQAAQAGRWLGGRLPFGWRPGTAGSVVLDPAPAREIREASRALLAGASLGGTVADLNRRGVLTATGRLWSYTALRQVLTRPRNAGLVDFHGEVVGRSPWPPIVGEDTWQAVTALLGDPARRRSTTNRVRWLLAGIARCGVCGGPLRTASTASNRRTGTTRTIYRCHVARAAEPVDDLVARVVVGRLSRPDAIDLLADQDTPDLDRLRDEAAATRAQLDEAAALYADGGMTAGQLRIATDRLRDRLRHTERQMVASTRADVLADLAGAADVQARWAALSLARRRAVVAALVTVTILPSGRRGTAFDPELVRIEWKGATT